MAFQIGDIVQLKSGGPLMTVEHVDVGHGPHVSISCVCTDTDGMRRQAHYEAAMLDRVDKPRPTRVRPRCSRL
jgi:uncharacterized protein YodC (DUF2158 family)